MGDGKGFIVLLSQNQCDIVYLVSATHVKHMVNESNKFVLSSLQLTEVLFHPLYCQRRSTRLRNQEGLWDHDDLLLGRRSLPLELSINRWLIWNELGVVFPPLADLFFKKRQLKGDCVL